MLNYFWTPNKAGYNGTWQYVSITCTFHDCEFMLKIVYNAKYTDGVRPFILGTWKRKDEWRPYH